MHQVSSLSFQLAEASSKAKPGWGHSLLPIPGKAFLRGFINTIYMVYKHYQITAIQCVPSAEQKRAVLQAPLLSPNPFTSKPEVISTLLGTRQVNAD